MPLSSNSSSHTRDRIHTQPWCNKTSGLNHLFSQQGKLLSEKVFQVFRGFRDWGVWLVEKTAVLEDSHHVADKLAQLAVVLLRDALLNGLQIHWLLDHFVIIGHKSRIDRFLKRGSVAIRSELLDEFLQQVVICGGEWLQIGLVELRPGVALWAIVLVDFVGFTLQDSDAAAVIPLRAPLTPDVELGLVVGLPAQAVDLVVVVSGSLALVTHVLFQLLRHALRDLH